MLGGALGLHKAEHRAWIAEQTGRGGSLIKELRLLKSHFCKPASSTLCAKDGTPLSNSTDKLNHWAQHFEEVVNYSVEVDNISAISLPSVNPTPHVINPEDTASDIDICSCLLKLLVLIRYLQNS